MNDTKTYTINEKMLHRFQWLTSVYAGRDCVRPDSFMTRTVENLDVTVNTDDPIYIDTDVLRKQLPNLRRVDIYNSPSAFSVNIRCHLASDKSAPGIQVCLHMTRPFTILIQAHGSFFANERAEYMRGQIRFNLDFSDISPEAGNGTVDAILAYNALSNGIPRDQYRSPELHDSLLKMLASSRKDVMLAAIEDRNEAIVDQIAGLKGTRAETWDAWADAADTEDNVIIRAKILDAMHKAVDAEAYEERKEARDLRNILNPFSLDNMRKIFTVSRVGKQEFRISGCKSEIRNLMIPDQIEGIPVTEIGSKVFKSQYPTIYEFDEVRLGSIRRIGEEGFSRAKIASMEFSPCLYAIGNYAFCGTEFGGKEYHLPESVLYIGGNAFSFSSITLDGLPSGLLRIGGNAFSQITVHGDLDCPNLTYIGCEAFREVKGLNRVRIGNCCMDAGCFTGSSVREARLESCGIPAECFHQCMKLKKVECKNARIIGERAMKDCKALQQVILGKNLEHIERKAFDGIPKDCTFLVPEGCEEKYMDMLTASGLAHPKIETLRMPEPVPEVCSPSLPRSRKKKTVEDSAQMDIWSFAC